MQTRSGLVVHLVIERPATASNTRTENIMELGMVGLGRMGANLVRRVSRAGHHCVVFDVNPAAVTALEVQGATGASSLEALVSSMSAPRRCG